jgi:hypothetical protein
MISGSGSFLRLGGELRRGCCPPVNFRAVFGLISRFGGGGLSLSESDEISIISFSEGLGFAGGAGGFFDETLDGGWLDSLTRCDPASEVDGLELLDAAAFCSEVSSREAFSRVKSRVLFPKFLRGASAGGAMDEDVLARAEIEVEVLEGPATEDEIFEVVGGTAIISSALDRYKTASPDTPGAEMLPTPSLISGALSLRRFDAVPMAQPPSFLLRG